MDRVAYTGTFLQQRKNDALKLEVYDPSPELVEAVNLAILLEQPLLLMGEPGTGKTRLAEAVAAELHGEHYSKHYFRWDVKSTSRAKDGIYQYDALARLYDANAGNAKARFVEEYISYGKLAKAFNKPQNVELPNILLIDEIDKADIDFPNDLLLEIEKEELFIPELNWTVKKKSRVIIFITSNRERELPPAFLRRCLYHYISFPKKEDLIRIVSAKYDTGADDKLVSNAVNLFLDLREKLDGQLAGNEKKPATSELLEWFGALHHYKKKLNGQVMPDGVKTFVDMVETYEKGDLDKLRVPFPQALLKTWESNQLVGAR